MKKNIQPKLHEVTFKCATCGSEYKVESTLKQDVVSIDVCSNCHPFYKGGNTNQKVKGRAEKLSSKFDAGKQNLGKKAAKTKKTATSKANNKVIKSLDDLKQSSLDKKQLTYLGNCFLLISAKAL